VSALLLPAALHAHHHGSPLDYIGLAAATGASWIGLPGPGEPVLIGAGVLAARGRLDLSTVLVVAWVSATVGGILGWAIGLKAGRRLVIARGPLRRLRLRAITRGERIFQRYPVWAILLTPSWIAGIHRVRPTVYNVTNVVSAAVWAAAIGLGAYFAGSSVIDFVNDFGLGTTVILVVVILVAVGAELARRRRHRGGQAQS
jgi:membrane protein DedA with SNARE-associated domain